MLTVLTWLWSQPGGGGPTYTAEHVNIWADMVRRNLAMPHRLACVTRTPAGIDQRIDIIDPPGDFESVRIPTWPEDRPQCLRRLSMFRPDAGRIFGDRFVCIDMDCVIAEPLDPLFDTDADFKMYRGTMPERPYNGSLLLMNAGARPQVFERFTPKDAVVAGLKFVGSDQAWIAYVLGRGEKTWSFNDGVLLFGSKHNIVAPAKRVMFFVGAPKPWEVLFENDWVSEHYRRTPHVGRCLVLGYAPSLWDEVNDALETGPFDAVIASPEAAKHWPGKPLAIARHDRDADRLVRMHGFSDVVYCGKTETEVG